MYVYIYISINLYKSTYRHTYMRLCDRGFSANQVAYLPGGGFPWMDLQLSWFHNEIFLGSKNSTINSDSHGQFNVNQFALFR